MRSAVAVGVLSSWSAEQHVTVTPFFVRCDGFVNASVINTTLAGRHEGRGER